MKKVIIILIVLTGIGYGGYKAVLSYASDKMIEQVTNEVLNEDEVNKLLDDPEIKQIVEQEVDESVATEDLPFHTKEDALKTLTKKFSMSELNTLKDKVVSGEIDSQQLEEVKGMLMDKLTPEEWEALKIVALKEWQKGQ